MATCVHLPLYISRVDLQVKLNWNRNLQEHGLPIWVSNVSLRCTGNRRGGDMSVSMNESLKPNMLNMDSER